MGWIENFLKLYVLRLIGLFLNEVGLLFRLLCPLGF